MKVMKKITFMIISSSECLVREFFKVQTMQNVKKIFKKFILPFCIKPH